MQIAIVASGSVSSLGIGRSQILEGFLNNKCNSKIIHVNHNNYPVFEVHDNVVQALEKLQQSNKKRYHSLDKTALYAVLATEQIVSENKELLRGRGMISIGTSRGNTILTEKFLSEYLQSSVLKTSLHTSPLTTFGNISAEVAAYIDNPEITLIDNSQTCTSSLHAIINGIAWLKADMADWVIAGGSEAAITPFTLAQTNALGIYSDILGEAYPCRPFGVSDSKNTFVLGEGAAVFLLMKEQAQRKKIGSIVSYGSAFHMPPSRTGIDASGKPLFMSMNQAIVKSSLQPDIIIAHAPGTLQGDSAEWNAIQTVFQNEIPFVLSSKYLLGHTYGASAGLSLELALAMLENNFPISVPYQTYIQEKSNLNVNAVLINATGFGGNAASLLITR